MASSPAPRWLWLSLVTRTLACAALLAAGLLIHHALVVSAPQPERVDLDTELPQVTVLPAPQLTAPRQWRGFGNVQAYDSADVPSQVRALVVDVPEAIRQGSAVSKGDLLATLDAEDFTRQAQIAKETLAQLDAELAQLEVEAQFLASRLKLEQESEQLAASELARLEKLLASGAARQQDVDRAREARIAAQRAVVLTQDSLARVDPRRASLQARRGAQETSLRLAEEDVRRCRILSPLAGVLEAVDVEEGEQVQPGQRIARVVSLARLEILLQLPAAARDSVQVGAVVTLAGNDGKMSWTGTITRINPSNNAQTRTMTVYVELVHEPANLKLAPGQYVEGVVTIKGNEPLIVLPRRAVVSDRVMLVDRDGHITSAPVEVAYPLEMFFPQLNLPDDQWVALASGVEAGQQVVVNPGRNVVEGMRVQPVNVRELENTVTPAFPTEPTAAQEAGG